MYAHGKAVRVSQLLLTLFVRVIRRLKCNDNKTGENTALYICSMSRSPHS